MWAGVSHAGMLANTISCPHGMSERRGREVGREGGNREVMRGRDGEWGEKGRMGRREERE